MVFLGFLVLLEGALTVLPKLFVGSRLPEGREGDVALYCMGDSVTFGTGVEAEESWPAQLHSLIQEGGDAAAVYNFAMPAARLRDLPARVNLARRPEVQHARATFLLQAGHNDVIGWRFNKELSDEDLAGHRVGASGRSPFRLVRIFQWVASAAREEVPSSGDSERQAGQNLDALVTYVRENHPAADIVLLTYVVPGVATGDDYAAQVINTTRTTQQAYNQEIRNVAAARGLPLVDLERRLPAPSEWSDEWFTDNIHLTAMGYGLQAAEVLRVLREEGLVGPQ